MGRLLHCSVEELYRNLWLQIIRELMADVICRCCMFTGKLDSDIIVRNSRRSTKGHTKSTIQDNAAKPSPLSKFLVQRGKPTRSGCRVESQLKCSFHCKTVDGPCFDRALCSLQILAGQEKKLNWHYYYVMSSDVGLNLPTSRLVPRMICFSHNPAPL